MAANVPVLHLFANDVGPEQLSLLDNNFSPLLNAINTPASFGNYYVDSGGVNALAVSLGANQNLAALTDGLIFQIKVANTNTSTTPTLNVAGLGAKTIVTSANTALGAGQLLAGSTIEVVYDAVNNVYRFLSAGGSGTGLFSSGTAGNPGVSFFADNTTGMYLSAVGVLGFSAGGTSMATVNNGTGWSFTGGTAISPATTGTLNVAPAATRVCYSTVFTNTSLVTAFLADNQSTAAAAAAGISLTSNTTSFFLNVFNNAAAQQVTAGPTGAQILYTGDLTTQPDHVFAINNIARLVVIATASQSVTGYGPVAAAQVDMTPDHGSFTGTFNGFTVAQTGTVNWYRQGQHILVILPFITGTSNSTSFTMTGVPAAIQPAAQQYNVALAFNLIEDNTAVTNGSVQIAPGGTWTFLKNGVVAGWTAAGTKGFQTGALSFSYALA